MRNLLSIAITQIAKKTFTNGSVVLGEVCPADNETFVDGNGDDGILIEGFYDWSEALQGIILSSFYWGYIITHIPGGILVEKFGGKLTLLFGIAATSVLTILTPLSISMGGSTLLIVNRVVMGLCQGFIYASVFGLLATWIPLKERTTLGVFVLSGIQVKVLIKFRYKLLTFKMIFNPSDWIDIVLLPVGRFASVHRWVGVAVLHLQHRRCHLVCRICKIFPRFQFEMKNLKRVVTFHRCSSARKTRNQIDSSQFMRRIF